MSCSAFNTNNKHNQLYVPMRGHTQLIERTTMTPKSIKDVVLRTEVVATIIQKMSTMKDVKEDDLEGLCQIFTSHTQYSVADVYDDVWDYYDININI